MWRFAPTAAVLATAIAVWLAAFFGAAYALVWLIETFEGNMSECWSSECGRFGEFLDDHQILTLAILALAAALPALAVFWKGRDWVAARIASPP
jgi:hypothetical protein